MKILSLVLAAMLAPLSSYAAEAVPGEIFQKSPSAAEEVDSLPPWMNTRTGFNAFAFGFPFAQTFKLKQSSDWTFPA